MQRNTKILLGVGAGVLAYLIYRASKANAPDSQSEKLGPDGEPMTGKPKCPSDETALTFSIFNKDRSISTTTKCKKTGEAFLRAEDCPSGTYYSEPPKLGGPGYQSEARRMAESPLCISEVLDPVVTESVSAYDAEIKFPYYSPIPDHRPREVSQSSY